MSVVEASLGDVLELFRDTEADFEVAYNYHSPHSTDGSGVLVSGLGEYRFVIYTEHGYTLYDTGELEHPEDWDDHEFDSTLSETNEVGFVKIVREVAHDMYGVEVANLRGACLESLFLGLAAYLPKDGA